MTLNTDGELYLSLSRSPLISDDREMEGRAAVANARCGMGKRRTAVLFSKQTHYVKPYTKHVLLLQDENGVLPKGGVVRPAVVWCAGVGLCLYIRDFAF